MNVEVSPDGLSDSSNIVSDWLSRIKLVMVNTSHAGNIGAAARGMKNMGLSQLVLVDPLDFPSSHATARASGAADVLHQATVVSTLAEAVADCVWVVGASARLRRHKQQVFQPADAARSLLEKLQTQQSAQPYAQVALVFGREDSGLTNEELDLCHALTHVPTNPNYSSLNVSVAVALYAYELSQAVSALAAKNHVMHATTLNQVEKTEQTLASHSDMEGFFDHLLQTLHAIGYVKHAHTHTLMRRLREAVYRADLRQDEVQMFRGMFKRVLSLSHATTKDGHDGVERI